MSFSPDPDPLKQPEEVKKINTLVLILFLTALTVKKAFTKNILECFLILNMILLNILREYLIKVVNLLVLFEAPRFVTETISSTNL